MTKKVRASFGLLVVVAALALSSCGHYVCNNTDRFGSGTCTASGSGFGGGTTSNSTAAAFVYAVDTAGTVDGYDLSTSAGTLSAFSGITAPTISSGDFGVGMVVAQGKFVYEASQAAGGIYGWSMGSSGALTALSNFPVAVLNMSDIASYYYNQQVLITNPAGTLLFLSEFGQEQIYVWQISSSGALTAVSGSPFSTLGASIEPDNMAMDGLGKFLYVTSSSDDHYGSFIAVYSVASNGALTLQSGSQGQALPIWQFVGEPSGKYMIGTSGKVSFLYGQDDKNLYVYSINSTTGLLTPVTNSPFATSYAPFNIAVSPTASNGTFVYSFSVNDGNSGVNPVEGYQLNTTTGALTAVQGSPFTNLGSGWWGQFDQSGENLLVYNASTTSSGTTVQMVPLAVGTTGALTQPISTASLATAGYWVVTDPQ